MKQLATGEPVQAPPPDTPPVPEPSEPLAMPEPVITATESPRTNEAPPEGRRTWWRRLLGL